MDDHDARPFLAPSCPPLRIAPRAVHLSSAFKVTVYWFVIGSLAWTSGARDRPVVFFAAIAVLYLTLLLRSFRTCLHLGCSMVVVKNYWRTIRFSWSEVKEVRKTWDYLFGINASCVGFVLHQRRFPIPSAATTHMGSQRAEFLERLIDTATKQSVLTLIDIDDFRR
jgi:hypothetical protein